MALFLIERVAGMILMNGSKEEEGVFSFAEKMKKENEARITGRFQTCL